MPINCARRVPKWLWRWTQNQFGSARRSSNPLAVDLRQLLQRCNCRLETTARPSSCTFVECQLGYWQCGCWAEARIKITRMTLTIKLDRNWSSFQLANSAPPLSVTGSAIAPSARMLLLAAILMSIKFANKNFDATLTQVPNPSSNLRFPVIVTETDPVQHSIVKPHLKKSRQEHSPQGIRSSSCQITLLGVLPLAVCHASATPEDL